MPPPRGRRAQTNMPGARRRRGLWGVRGSPACTRACGWRRGRRSARVLDDEQAGAKLARRHPGMHDGGAGGWGGKTTWLCVGHIAIVCSRRVCTWPVVPSTVQVVDAAESSTPCQQGAAWSLSSGPSSTYLLSSSIPHHPLRWSVCSSSSVDVIIEAFHRTGRTPPSWLTVAAEVGGRSVVHCRRTVSSRSSVPACDK